MIVQVPCPAEISTQRLSAQRILNKERSVVLLMCAQSGSGNASCKALCVESRGMDKPYVMDHLCRQG